MRTTVTAALLLLGLLTGASASAFAAEVVISRNVTARAEPDRRSAALRFPAIGTAVRLLDDGAKVRGYYHVELDDGTGAWIYSTFTRLRGPSADLLPGPDDVARVHFIDVEQGAATLLEFPCAAVMIDTGGRGPTAAAHLRSYLDTFFARRTDLQRRLTTVFVTHTHIDHNSNLRRLAEAFTIGGYVHNGVLDGSGRNGARWMSARVLSSPTTRNRPVSETEVAAAGSSGLTDAVIDAVDCPRFDPDIRILSGRYDANPGWPDGDFENGNNQSLVIRVAYGKATFLFDGDLEEEAIGTLLERYGTGGLLDVDVYDVGHHGSHNGTTVPFLAAMSPRIAVMSMGSTDAHELWTAWAYGHPRRVTVEALEAGVSGTRDPIDVLVGEKAKSFTSFRVSHAVYATGWDGDIVLTAHPDGRIDVATTGRGPTD